MGAFAGSVAAGRRAWGGVGPNERIVVGMIGVGTHGLDRLREFLRHADVRIGAVCDVDGRHRDRALREVESAKGYRPKAVKDFRRVLDDPDIDAVAVVTPDHWHSIPTVRACEAGKDVFVEKPLGYSIAEGRAMADASLRYRRVTQMGNHIHNDLPNYRRVVELVKSGLLGKITRVNCWKTAPTAGRGFPADEPAPAEVDYDFWLGPAPDRPFNRLRFHNSFRHFWDYSGGTFLDFFCHIADVAFWALDLAAPRTVSAVGGRFFVDDATETPDCLEVTMDFPGLTFLFSYHPKPLPGLERMGHIGCVFQGTEATLVTNYGTHEILVDGKPVPDFPRPDPTIPDSPGHLREFLDAVKSRDLETTCNLRYGHRLTKPALLANLAFRTGEKIRWDDDREEILGESSAKPLLTRQFRKPWSL
jgi:predicted dehydrogenase